MYCNPSNYHTPNDSAFSNTVPLWKDKFTASIFQFYPSIKRHFISLNISSASIPGANGIKVISRTPSHPEINPHSKKRDSNSFDRQSDLSASNSIDISLFIIPRDAVSAPVCFSFPLSPFKSPFLSLYRYRTKSFSLSLSLDDDDDDTYDASIPDSPVILKYEVIKREKGRPVSDFRGMLRR